LPIPPDLFRRVLGSFASGVTVVTTGLKTTYHCMTASSFSSLSLEPPLVLVCIDRSSRTLPVLLEAGHFNLNILNAGQERLARLFASRDAPHSVEGIDHRLGGNGMPVFEGAVAHLECRLYASHEGGDHVIIVGEVDAADYAEDGEPLLYYRAAYRSLNL